MLKQKSGNYEQKHENGRLGSDAIEALKGSSTSNEGNLSLRLSNNRPTGLNLKHSGNLNIIDNRKSSELTPCNPFNCLPSDSAQEQHTSEFFKGELMTPDEQRIRKMSFEG